MSLGIELRDIFVKYRATVFEPLIKYDKRPDLAGAPFEKKFEITGDYPDDMGAGKLIGRENPLCVLLCVVEGGDISRAVEFGTRDYNRQVRMGLDIYSHDPDLRERIGDSLFGFCTRNQALIGGVDGWTAISIQSNGNTSSNFRGVYRRTYGLWLSVPAKF